MYNYCFTRVVINNLVNRSISDRRTDGRNQGGKEGKRERKKVVFGREEKRDEGIKTSLCLSPYLDFVSSFFGLLHHYDLSKSSRHVVRSYRDKMLERVTVCIFIREDTQLVP